MARRLLAGIAVSLSPVALGAILAPLLGGSLWLSAGGIILYLFLVANTWYIVRGLTGHWLSRLERVISAPRGTSSEMRLPSEIGRIASAFSALKSVIDQSSDEARTAYLTRDVAVREVHHRVKNNLQLVTSMVNLQMRVATSDEGRDALATLNGRVGVLAAAHHALYRSERLEMVAIEPFLEMVVTHVAGVPELSDAKISFNSTLGDIERPSDQAVPLALFVLEGVSLLYDLSEETDPSVVISLGCPTDYPGIRLQIGIESAIPSRDTQDANNGLKYRLMMALSRQVGGSAAFDPDAPSAMIVLEIPMPEH